MQDEWLVSNTDQCICAKLKQGPPTEGHGRGQRDRPSPPGNSPHLWRQGTNCMLEKRPGNFRVDMLHTILLYKIQFNMANKILGRDCMFFAEDLSTMVGEQ